MAPSVPNLPLQPGVVTLSAAEREAGQWSRANIQKILELMHRDGLAVLDGCVADTTILDRLRVSMAATSNEIRASKTSVTDFNHGVRSNFLQSPPLTDKSLLFAEVYQNRFAVAAVEAYLGKGSALAFLTANTALASTTDRQPVHKDASFIHPAAPYMAVVNYLLTDFRPSNGSTEFWLGSHNQTLPIEQVWKTADAIVPTCNIRQELLDERRKTRPPIQVEVPFGCLLLRDPRTWHAGMPNPSEEDRTMIALGYTAPWFPRDNRFLAPLSAEPVLTSNPDLECLATFIPDAEWEQVCQKWGAGEPMQLKYLPKPESWVTETMLKPEEKVVVADVVAVSG